MTYFKRQQMMNRDRMRVAKRRACVDDVIFFLSLLNNAGCWRTTR